MLGVTAAVAYILKAQGRAIEPGATVDNTSDRWGLNIVYNQGPLKAAITADKTSKWQPAGIGGVVDPSRAASVNWTVGGAYTFGKAFAMSLSYNRANSAAMWRGGGGAPRFGARRYGWELGGSFFSGPFTLTLDLTRDTKNELYAPNKKYTNGVVEAKYSLSKRTFLYANYLRLDGDGNYGLGIYHSF
jgi:predicted porin